MTQKVALLGKVSCSLYLHRCVNKSSNDNNNDDDNDDSYNDNDDNDNSDNNNNSDAVINSEPCLSLVSVMLQVNYGTQLGCYQSRAFLEHRKINTKTKVIKMANIKV